MTPMGADPRWALLEAARERLIASFADRGVARIEYVAAWPRLAGVGVWLCTETDAERDALGSDNFAAAEVEAVLRECGLDDRDLGPGLLATTAQSQETVDRQYSGSWFYAMR
jgi:hypothetical protein